MHSDVRFTILLARWKASENPKPSMVWYFLSTLTVIRFAACRGPTTPATAQSGRRATAAILARILAGRGWTTTEWYYRSTAVKRITRASGRQTLHEERTFFCNTPIPDGILIPSLYLFPLFAGHASIPWQGSRLNHPAVWTSSRTHVLWCGQDLSAFLGAQI